MKSSVFKLFFVFLMATFSLIWISDKLSVFLEKEKYSYYETTGNNDSENQSEIKLKTLFISQIGLLNLIQFSSSNAQNNNSSYSFNVKEFCFESHTPPPEIA